MSGFLIYPFKSIYPKVSLNARIVVFAKDNISYHDTCGN